MKLRENIERREGPLGFRCLEAEAAANDGNGPD